MKKKKREMTKNSFLSDFGDFIVVFQLSHHKLSQTECGARGQFTGDDMGDIFFPKGKKSGNFRKM